MFRVLTLSNTLFIYKFLLVFTFHNDLEFTLKWHTGKEVITKTNKQKQKLCPRLRE